MPRKRPDSFAHRARICAGCLFACVAAFGAETVTNGLVSAKPSPFDGGVDLRIRQEIMHNVPGLPGDGHSVMSAASKEAQNHIRFRPRIWGSAACGNFRLYGRLADEFREYVVKNGKRRDDRNYNFPDELIVDNLYLEGTGLADDFFDFRVGRQDLFDGKHSVFNLDRLMLDGAPYVGSRSCYADMARVTFHTSDDSKLDLFGLYDNGRNPLRWGNHLSDGRPMNALHPADSPGMDEWGGGAVWADKLFEKRLPYQLYAIHKHTEAYTTSKGVRMSEKQITTLGMRFEPQVTTYFSFDFEGAGQVGTKSDGNKQAGGWMGYAAADFHPDVSKAVKPFVNLSAKYYSGDTHRTDDKNDNDTAWDPLWARAPCDSELFQYGTLYALGYWSNMLYTKLTLGAEFGPHHRLSAYSGPMWSVADDGLGHADGSGGSNFKGILSAARYDFPIVLADRKKGERFEIFGHLLAEVFNPGDYFDSSRPAYFLRWEITFRF